MPRIIPEPRYFSMPSIDVGAEARMKRDLNCWPWVRSLTHSPDAVTHSPAAITAALQEIWMAETKKDAVTALEAFVETYQVKYQRAADCLTKDRDALLAFYDFPA